MQQQSLPSLSEPDVFARQSPRAQKANRYLCEGLGQIHRPQLTALVSQMLAPLHDNKANWLLSDNSAARHNAPEFCEFLSHPPLYESWWGAPAAAQSSHHCYPGGWLMHNATNLHSLKMQVRTAIEVRGLAIDAEAMMAAMLLHDCLKPRLLVWQDGQMLSHPPGCSHHVGAIAEAWLQGAAPQIVVLLAGVHCGWWHSADGVRGYLEQAAQLIDQPKLATIADGLPQVDLLPQTWIIRLAEEAWYLPTKRAIQTLNEPLQQIITKLISPKDRQAAQWQVLAQYDELELLQSLAEETLEETVRKVLLAPPFGNQ